MGIKEELDQKRQESIVKAEPKDEIKLLMAPGSNSQKEALRTAGLDREILAVESKKGVEIDRNNNESTYGNTVFTEDEIKDICIK